MESSKKMEGIKTVPKKTLSWECSIKIPRTIPSTSG
jgi:hypothetical protein